MSAHPPDPAPFPRDVLRRLVGVEPISPLRALESVPLAPTEVEGYRPLAESLEWRLADAYWEQFGTLPFVRNDVPYLVNNTGRLSENAAALAFAAFEDAGAALPERIFILELGAGSGLHARFFLDAFQDLCTKERRDFYERVTYVVTDRAERTIDTWRAAGVFAEHEGHVALCTCDAMSPERLVLPGGKLARDLGPPIVVFCNYLLDVLPSRIVRRSESGLEELCVRTHVSPGPLKLAGFASLEEAQALVASRESDAARRLLPLLPDLELETAFRAWGPQTEAEKTLAGAMAGNDRVILNAGALSCLEKLLANLPQHGFVLVNDYGPVRAEDVKTHVGVQRFGGSVALGLNFALLERVLAERGVSVHSAEGDEGRRVHTRLIARSASVRTRAVFGERFRLEADQHRDAPVEEARGHVASGRRNEALEAYRVLIERNPHDWQMLGEAAEYVGLQLHDYAAGLQLVRAALVRNPWYSTWLWNILGDCLFYTEKLADAHAAFEQASRIDPDDPRTNLNLAYTLSAQGEQSAALEAVARGLAHDGRGLYRPRLLEKQAQILAVVSDRAAAIQNALARRAERFR